MRKIRTQILLMGTRVVGETVCDAPDELEGWSQRTTLGALADALAGPTGSGGQELIELVRRYGSSALTFEVSIGAPE